MKSSSKSWYSKVPGPDLEVYLAEDHFWMGGSKESQAGHSYVANIPTEEVFTTPPSIVKVPMEAFSRQTKAFKLNGKIVDGLALPSKMVR